MTNKQATHHGYARYYEPLLAPLRQSAVRLLEIGVEDGASLAGWREFFPAAEQVWGVGLGAGDRQGLELSGKVDWGEGGVADCGQDPGPPCAIIRGDQSDSAFLAQLVRNTGGNFTVVVDDGSHLPAHQLFTLEALWPSVAPGGLYIVEDVETRSGRLSYYSVSINLIPVTGESRRSSTATPTRASNPLWSE